MMRIVVQAKVDVNIHQCLKTLDLRCFHAFSCILGHVFCSDLKMSACRASRMTENCTCITCYSRLSCDMRTILLILIACCAQIQISMDLQWRLWYIFCTISNDESSRLGNARREFSSLLKIVVENSRLGYAGREYRTK